MSAKVPDQLLSFIKNHSGFVLLGHKEPDGDCLGSQLALAGFLKRIGKTVSTYSPGPFERPEIKHLEPLFKSGPEIDEPADENAVMILDCSTPERLGPLEHSISGFPTAVIDHHSSGSIFGDVRYVSPKTPSTTLLILNLIHAMGMKPDAREAELLFFGICTDTGFFRHLDHDSADVFTASAELAETGVSPNRIYGEIYGNRSLKSRVLLGTLLSRTETHFSGKLLLTWETLEDLEKGNKSDRDSDMLYMLLQGTESVQVVILFREETADECSVGLRSNDSFDVGAVAKEFGGGGHKRAAGFTWFGTIGQIKSILLDHLTDLL